MNSKQHRIINCQKHGQNFWDGVLDECLRTENQAKLMSHDRIEEMKRGSDQLVRKGVIIER